MEYKFCTQRLGTWDQLDPSWLSLLAANNLPILMKGVTWMKRQIDNQVVERVRAMVTCSPVSSAVLIILGINIQKDLALPHLLAKFEHTGQCA